MRGPRRTGFSCTCVATAFLLTSGRVQASSARDLVAIARAHEQAKREDLALLRYNEALRLDPTCEDAYLGLGSLRARRGDLREAERVYTLALERLAGLSAARLARAFVRRALGSNDSAIDDLLASMADETAALRTIASWYGEDGHTPAQLATWRRLVSRAEVARDASLLHEARTMVRALIILVGTADPAAAPADGSGRDDGVRRTIRILVRKGP
jgi:tetratricopeptide (TPR) repeat protein